MKPSSPDRHTATERRLGWAVVVPVKRWAVAKSRLASLGDEARNDLVAAMALDTVQSLANADSVALVVVVTDEPRMAGRVHHPKVVTVEDRHTGDLNASLCLGATEAQRARSDLPVVAVCADLPSLRATEVDELLARAWGLPSWFVADADGVGTSMYAATSLAGFDPAFGPASRARHLDGGAVEITAFAGPSLRADVDVPGDLAAVLGLGVGTLTMEALTRHRLAPADVLPRAGKRKGADR